MRDQTPGSLSRNRGEGRRRLLSVTEKPLTSRDRVLAARQTPDTPSPGSPACLEPMSPEREGLGPKFQVELLSAKWKGGCGPGPRPASGVRLLNDPPQPFFASSRLAEGKEKETETPAAMKGKGLRLGGRGPVYEPRRKGSDGLFKTATRGLSPHHRRKVP